MVVVMKIQISLVLWPELEVPDDVPEERLQAWVNYYGKIAFSKIIWNEDTSVQFEKVKHGQHG